MKLPDARVTAPRLVLLGLDTLQGLQAARILASRGVPVIGIAGDRDHYACRTRVCERVIIGETSGPGALALLADLGVELGTGSILLPCQDHAVLTLSRNRQALEPFYRYALPAPEVVETLTNKARFYELAAAQGLRVPETHLLRDPQDAEQVAATLRFPVILKPTMRSMTWNALTRSKLFRAENARELLECYQRVRARTGERRGNAPRPVLRSLGPAYARAAPAGLLRQQGPRPAA